MRRSRFVVLLVVGAFVFTACGGGDDAGGGTTGGAGATAAGVAGPLDAVECAQVVTAMAAAAAAIPQVMSGEAGDLSTSVDQLEAMAAKAPEEIRDDLLLVAQGYATYSAALQNSGWDPASGEAPPPEVVAALTEASQALDDADFQAASERVSAWFATNCGS
jgi:hypothetical protein